MPLLPSVKLQPHQQRVAEDAKEHSGGDVPYRRMLVWGLGSGKGLGSIAAAESLGEPYAAVVPAALRPTYKAEQQKFTDLGTPSEVLSYNAIARGASPNVNTVVFDEAQRMGGATTQAQAARQLADKARNVILLSGTPVRNDPAEFATLFNTLTGLNLTPEEFRQRYVGIKKTRPGGFLGWLRGLPFDEKETLQNVDELKQLLAGKVDYYHPEKPINGPNVKYEDVYADMSPLQTQIYEGLWNKLPYLTRLKLKYGYGLQVDDLRRLQSFLTGPRQVGLSIAPFQSRKDYLGAFESSGKLKTAFNALQQHLKDPRTKAVVYSNFVDAGLRPYAAALSKAKIPYAMFHGSMTDRERKKVVEDFNKGNLRVALISPAASEGLSLKGAQLFQRLDNHFHEARGRQAEGRILRFDSHSDLPEDLRNVTVQRFVSRLPLSISNRLLENLGFDRTEQRYATDDYLREMAKRKDALNQQLMDLLKDIGSNKQAAAFEWAMDAVGEAAEKYAAEKVKVVKPYSVRALIKGTKVEFEHTDIPAVAQQIATDHLREDPKYYDKLEKIEKHAELAPDKSLIGRLQEAKQHSDRREWDAKTDILRQLIQQDHEGWMVDSVADNGIWGITHKRTGFRFHLPRTVVADLLHP